MTFKGHIKNGVVVFVDGVPLPEGTEVVISRSSVRTRAKQPKRGGSAIPARQRAGKKRSRRSKAKGVATLLEHYRSLIGAAKGLPRDFAAQHDHYIHGAPKR